MGDTGTCNESNWFATQVWAGREQLAASHLRSRGYEIFCPQYREFRRWSDRVKPIDRALFAGYLFCRLDRNVFGKLLTAPYVIRLVGDGERPLPIPGEEMAAVHRIVDANLQAEPWPFPRAGERVSIAAGPLGGTEGIVIRSNGRHRLVVSISLLQRSVAVEVDARWITTAAPLLHG